MTTTANEALYLYYLAHAESPGQTQPADMDQAGRLFAHSHAGCTALVGIVRIDDFCGPEAERRLSDLKWVSERAFGHERVVECGFRHGPVFPARFGTLFSSLGALERFIERKSVRSSNSSTWCMARMNGGSRPCWIAQRQ